MVEADSKQPLEATDSEKKIIRQIEYYFGDINLVKDKFLQEEIKKDDGWVSLDTLLTFKRLAALTNDKTVITESLKKSTSGLIEINDDKSKIRRTPNLPVPEMNDDRKKELAERTVYCKGFPKDSVLNDIIDFFSKYDGVDNVVMRNYHDKLTDLWHFKGSVFVNFKSVADAENFLKIESVKHEDTELIKKMINTYLEEKKQENMERNNKKNKKNKVEEPKEETEAKKAPEKEEMPIGSVIQLTGFVKEGIKREHIKESIENHGIAVAYVDFKIGDETAWVRFNEKGSSLELDKKLKENDGNGKLKLADFDDVELEVRILEGEEEQTFLERSKQDLAKRRANLKRGGNRRGRGRYSGRKRAGSPSAKNDSKKKC